MEEDKSGIFIVLEEHMQERYAYLIDKYNFKSYYVTNFGDLLLGASISKIIKRIYHRRILEQEYKKLKFWIKQGLEKSKTNKIYLSNSEGYVAHNFTTRLRKEFPEIKLIALQHGVFYLSKIPKKHSRNIINKVSKILFGIYPAGVGFGGKIVDQYIVYNRAYKDFLVQEYNWKPESVKVDFEFLKIDLYDKKVEGDKKEDTAVFLLQCLAKAKLCSDKDEAYLIHKTTEYLSKKHTHVLIKEHPACINEDRVELLSNCKYADNLVDAFNESKYAYSFTSTTLLDAQIFDIETFAIDSELLRCDKSIYKLFNKTLRFEDTIDV